MKEVTKEIAERLLKGEAVGNFSGLCRRLNAVNNLLDKKGKVLSSYQLIADIIIQETSKDLRLKELLDY